MAERKEKSQSLPLSGSVSTKRDFFFLLLSIEEESADNPLHKETVSHGEPCVFFKSLSLSLFIVYFSYYKCILIDQRLF